MEDNESPDQQNNQNNTPEDAWNSETTLADVIGAFLYKFKPKDVKELAEQFSRYSEAKLKIDGEYKKQELLLKEAHLRIRGKLAFQFQWIRFIILLVSGASVTYLIANQLFDAASALFFGGVVAYLFGKEPK